MTVPLPEVGDGSRRRRRRERQRGGRRTVTRALAIAVLVALLGAVGWVAVDLAQGDGSRVPAATGDPGAPDGVEPPGLLVLRDDRGAVIGVTVFAPATTVIAHIPPGLIVEVPSLGLESLRMADAEGGEALLRQSLENLLGLVFAEVVALDPTGLASLIEPVAPLSVAVDAAVEERGADGRVEVAVPAGTVVVNGADALPLLAAMGQGTALDRLVRHQAFWSAYLEAAAAAGATPPLRAIAALAGAEARQRVIPVEAVGGDDDGEELYRVVEADLAGFVGRLDPDAPGARGPRIRVQVLNGVGAPGIAQRVQPLLVEAGGRLTLSGNADRFDHEVTQVVYYDDARLDDARAVQAALGVGEVVKSRTGLAVVDVTVVVGADFLAAHPGG